MTTFLSQYPEIMSILIVLAGFLAASLIATGFDRLLNLMERGVRRLSPQRADQLATVTPRTVIQRIVYYVTLTFFLLLAVRILGITALSDWLDVTLAYMPQILIGSIIIVVGYLLGILVYSLVAGLAQPTGGELLARVAQTVVVITAVITGLEQMAIDVSFLTNVLVIVMAAILGGLSLAFAIGSRQLVANLLSRRDLARYRVGDVIRIGELQGRIIDFTRTSVVLESADGKVNVPAVRFLESEVTLIANE